MPNAPNHDEPLGPDELADIYEAATEEYIPLYNRWVEAGRPDGSADVPAPLDPNSWLKRFHPAARPRLQTFLENLLGGERAGGTPLLCPDGALASLDAFEIEREENGAEKELGHGGMGVVVSAREKVLGRPVAIKFILAYTHASPADVDQFWSEARLQSRLQHAGIAAVYQVGFDAARGPFIVMPPLTGPLLSELLKRADAPVRLRLTDRSFAELRQAGVAEPALAELNLLRDRELARSDWSDALARILGAHSGLLSPLVVRSAAPGEVDLLDVFLKVARTVAHAHQQGTQHLDLKPANVKVGTNGEVWVLDWGLAKGAIGPTGEGRVGAVAAPPERHFRSDDPGAYSPAGQRPRGTPQYMPPEQARGDRARVGPESDVFALGATLCAVLTGKAPYREDRTEALAQAQTWSIGEAFARLDRCQADQEVIDLCKRCLSELPADRPADGGAVAAAVEKYRAGVETRLRAAEREALAAEARVREQRAKRRLQVGLALVLGMSALAVGALAWRIDKQDADARQRLKKNEEVLENWAERCDGALRVGDAALAELALKEIEKGLPGVGGEAFRPQLKQFNNDLELLQGLIRIDEFRQTPVDGRYPPTEAVVAKWADACRRYGLVPGSTEPGEAVRIVAAARVKEQLLNALDLWLVSAPARDVRELLGAVDRDEFRDTVRDGVLNRRGADLERLAGRPTALKQGRFAAVLGQIPDVPLARRREILEAALGTDPRNLNLLMTLAETYPINRGDGAGARARWAQAAVAAQPKSVAAHNYLGIALKDHGDLAGAIRQYKEAIGLDPRYAVPHYNLGAALFIRGDLDGAMKEYERALELEPHFPQARNGLGNVLLKKGDLDGAAREYKAAGSLDAGYAYPRCGLGDVFKERGNFDEALRKYEIAVALENTNPYVRASFGDLLSQKGETTKAVAEYRAAATLAPRNAVLRNGFGEALRNAGDFDGAAEEYRAAVELDPGNANYRNNYGNVLKAKGDLGGAIREYRRAIALDPSGALPHYGLGNALSDTGDRKGAEASYREAVRLKIHLANAYTNSAILLAERGHLFAARQVLLDGLRVDPRFIGPFRYDLSCIACSAANGRAKDAPPDIDPPGLRREAARWLTDELAAQRELAGASPSRSVVHAAMLQWLADPDLAAVRDTERLPPDERGSWRELWAGVRALRDATESPPVAPGPRPVR